ncbi:DUF3328 domain-containing protein [Candidatus Bathyarchaeota archaeon]|nr:DUF3328 domain-containing protein [Candidatus Bathyarchaeota archaeon]
MLTTPAFTQNIIRQYTWRDWYLSHQDIVEMPHAIKSDSLVDPRVHADHCLEALRISLTCHGDTTPLFNILEPDTPLGAKVDFSPLRKCRQGLWPASVVGGGEPNK